MKTDVAIIGGGLGGYVAALRATQLGAKVVLIEREKLGGVCLNVGCIPTKALLHCAEVAETVRGAAKFGVQTSAPQIDWPAMQTHKTKVVERLVSGVGVLLKKADVTILNGHGRFLSPHLIAVEGKEVSEQVEADKVIIATGSRSATLPVPGLDSPAVLDSTAALALDKLPASIIIIGGGAIGVEFASLFHSLGVEVTLVEMLPRLLPLMDATMSDLQERFFKRRKMTVLTETKLKQVKDAGGQLEVEVETKMGTQTLRAEKMLLAVGRRANVENLDLEKAEVQFSRKGIPVDAAMRTNVSHIYAIGDVVGGMMLAHWAAHMGISAAENAMGGHVKLEHTAIPQCVFSLLEIASVGLSEQEARDKGYDVRIGAFPFLANGKALAQGESEGSVKVVAEGKYGQILGVHIAGPHASDIILAAGVGLTLEATWDEFRATIAPHPTLGEALMEAVLSAMGIPLHIPANKK